jgi:hypothetical protein
VQGENSRIRINGTIARQGALTDSSNGYFLDPVSPRRDQGRQGMGSRISITQLWKVSTKGLCKKRGTLALIGSHEADAALG